MLSCHWKPLARYLRARHCYRFDSQSTTSVAIKLSFLFSISHKSLPLPDILDPITLPFSQDQVIVQLALYAPPAVELPSFVMLKTEDAAAYFHNSSSSAFPLNLTDVGAAFTPKTVTLASGLGSSNVPEMIAAREVLVASNYNTCQ
jgi:hypothetical protein